MRIRQLAVTGGLAVALVATAAAPVSTALAAEKRGTDRPVAVSKPAPAQKSFGTVASYDATGHVLVVTTSAGGSVTAKITGRTKVTLVPAPKRKGKTPTTSPTVSASATATVSATATATVSSADDPTATPSESATAGPTASATTSPTATPSSTATPRSGRQRAIAALVPGATIKHLHLDPGTGALRQVVVVAATA